MVITRRVAALSLVAVFATLLAPMGQSYGKGSKIQVDPYGTPKIVAVRLADRAELDQLVDTGLDLAEYLADRGEYLEAHVVATPRELKSLRMQGFETLGTIYDINDWRERVAERQATLDKEDAPGEIDTLKVLRADYFENYAGKFVSVEVKTSAGNDQTAQMLATFGGSTGPTGINAPAALTAFVDSGAYMYHRALVPVQSKPVTVTIVSTHGGTATAAVKDWIGKPPKQVDPLYAKDFITHYMDPTEVYAAIDELVAQYPDLAEIVELPHQTNGYRRKAVVTLGSANASRVVVSSVAWGHEGGNDLQVQVIDPGTPNAPLTVSQEASLITVSLATDGAGLATSTAAQVRDAINVGSASVTATTYRGDAGGGVVAVQEPVALDDGLDAPESISREPWTVRAIRIGQHRDGSKPGVLAYSQEHAREWVTPLVAVETATRLLRNYATDPATQDLVDNLDIFIIPSVNPDGSHYSFHDFAMQRRNLANYCADFDPGRWNSVGVDINRNYGFGSIFDGYSGASSSCTSDTFSGPSELSEAESKNVIWLADTFTNITHSMNIHSYGGYFMWAPGAYKSSGRVSLPPPPLDIEAAFWGASERILQAIKDERGTVIQPGRTGPIADVLYSAAGNSADHLYYLNGIFAWSFEVGADIYNAQSRSWTPVNFQPTFAPEGHAEALEFSSGLIELFTVALDASRDHASPTSDLVASGRGWIFETDEPAAVYYTLDGSEPTFADATRYDRGGIRESGQVLDLAPGTVVRWFSVDTAGNHEEHQTQTI